MKNGELELLESLRKREFKKEDGKIEEVIREKWGRKEDKNKRGVQCKNGKRGREDNKVGRRIRKKKQIKK